MGKRVGRVLGLMILAVLGQVSAQQSGTGGAGTVDSTLSVVRGDAIRGHMRFLADPLLEGRAPDGRGYAIAARYVQAELEGMHCASIGMVPSQRVTRRNGRVIGELDLRIHRRNCER